MFNGDLLENIYFIKEIFTSAPNHSTFRTWGVTCPVYNGLDRIQLKAEIFLCKSKGAEKDTSFF
jgi:hypothetical protein